MKELKIKCIVYTNIEDNENDLEDYAHQIMSNITDTDDLDYQIINIETERV